MNKRFLILLPLLALMAFSSKKKVNIWLIGDSTMASKKAEREPESGWGVELASLFKPEGAIIHNHAASGRSSKSFIAEKRWQAVLDSIRPGDYVVIQFGHNDEKPDSDLHTEAFSSFKQNLIQFITQSRTKGASPVVCSSIVRRHFDAEGRLKDTHGDYITAAREAASETKTAFVDMEMKTRKLVTEMGPEKSKSLYVFCNPGECPKRPKGIQDSTHLNHYGSRIVASFFVEGIKQLNLPLAKLAR